MKRFSLKKSSKTAEKDAIDLAEFVESKIFFLGGGSDATSGISKSDSSSRSCFSRLYHEVDGKTCSEVCQRLGHLVSEEMQLLLVQQELPVAPDVIQGFYIFLQHCDQILRRINMMTVPQEFWKSLEAIKKQVLTINSNKLHSGQTQVMKLIENERREYMREMEELIEKNPEGIAQSEFSLVARRNYDRCLTRVERKLKNLPWSDEPVKFHKEMASVCLSKRTQDYQNANNDNFREAV